MPTDVPCLLTKAVVGWGLSLPDTQCAHTEPHAVGAL